MNGPCEHLKNLTEANFPVTSDAKCLRRMSERGHPVGRAKRVHDLRPRRLL